VKKITAPPQISSSELSSLKDHALKQYIEKRVDVEQVWWDACFYGLKKLGYEIVDPNGQEEKPLDNQKSKP